MLNKFVDWVCHSAWKHVDPQEQIFDIQLDITNACNLRCVHCYQEGHINHGALTYAQWVCVLDQYESLLRKLRMTPRILLCGGEPISCPYLESLLADIRSRFCSCDLIILTNGVLITRSIADLLRHYSVQVQVSLDGPDAPRNDSIRGAGSFDRTLRGCRHLMTAQVPLRHLTVLSYRTSQWIPGFFQLPKVTGAQSINFTRLIVEGQAKQMVRAQCDRPLVGDELRCALLEILRCSREFDVRTSTAGALWHVIDAHLGSGSNVGFNGLVVGYRGELKVTSRSPLVLGNVLDQGMEEIFFHHPVMKRLRRDEIDGCQECPHFQKCRGDRNASFAEYGHFFGPDPGCWLPYASNAQPIRVT